MACEAFHCVGNELLFVLVWYAWWYCCRHSFCQSTANVMPSHKKYASLVGKNHFQSHGVHSNLYSQIEAIFRYSKWKFYIGEYPDNMLINTTSINICSKQIKFIAFLFAVLTMKSILLTINIQHVGKCLLLFDLFHHLRHID